MTLRHPIDRRGFLRLTAGIAGAAAAPSLLAGCGNGAGDGKTLRLVGVADQDVAIKKLVAAYAKENADVTINASYAPTDQVQTSLRTQLGAGNAPDLHAVYPGNGSAMAMVQLAKANLLADLSDQKWPGLVPDNLKPTFQHEGKTFVYCAGTSVIGAIYNKKVFRQAGVELPTTWTGLLDACAKLKAAGIAPIAVGAQTPWVTQLITYALVPSTVYAEDPEFDDKQAAGKTSFAQSGWRKAMEMYLDLQRRGFLNDNPNGTTFEQQTSMVATGKAAMAVQVAGVLPAFRDAAASPDDIGMFPFPGADNAGDVWIPAGVAVGLGVSPRSKNLAAAKAFVEFLGEQRNINAWAEAIAAIPIKRDAQSKIDPLLEPFLPFIDAGKAVPFMDQRWPNAEVQPTHFAVIQELLAGKTDVGKALEKMDEAYRKK